MDEQVLERARQRVAEARTDGIAGARLDAALERARGEVMRYSARSAVRDFSSALTDLGELAAFVALGLTVDLALIGDAGLWWQGLVLAALLGLVIRPLVVTPLLLPVRLDWGERGFVVWSGLKGAVPILLASLAVVSGTDDAAEIYGIVFVVVLCSVVVQGSLVPSVAARLGVEMVPAAPHS